MATPSSRPDITAPRTAFLHGDWLKGRKSPSPGLMTGAQAAISGFRGAVVGGHLCFRFPRVCEGVRCHRLSDRRLPRRIMMRFRLSPVSGLVLFCLLLGEFSGPLL